ncbi:MAG: HD domain-containing phosphohydrolase [Nitrospirota bacterium]
MIIKTKIITIIALTIILTVGVTTAVLLRVQTKKILYSKFKDTEFISDIIERSIEHSMIEGNIRNIQQIIENIGKNKEILTLKIISPDGTVLKSTDPSEIGSKSREYASSSIKETVQSPYLADDKTINYFRIIPNKKECYGCHSKTENIVGVIQIKHDISRSFITMLSIKRLLIFSNITIVLIVSIILSFLFSHLVMKPLKNLLSTINDIEAGNMQATVKVTSDDEMGFIAKSFNKMIFEINKLYKKNLSKERELSRIKLELEHKNRVEELNSQLELKIKELETANRAISSLSKEVKDKNIELEKAVERLKKINEIGRILTSIIETEELMRIIIRTTADLINADKVVLHLKNGLRPSTTIQYRRGIGIENLSEVSLEINPSYSTLLNNGKTVLIHKSPAYITSDNTHSKSQIGVPLKLKGQIIGAILLEEKIDGSNFSEDELEILTTLSNQAMVAIENAWLYESEKSNYFATIQSLVNALEANDRFTKGHSERVRLVSSDLGKHIGLDYKELEVLEHAAILHDIGKIGIDSIVLQKQGKLTPKEYGLIKTHPQIGDEILGPIETLDGVRKTIIQHHERYDGNGYPHGLKGDEISLKSRILSVVDTFDAMMSDRPYRKAIYLNKIYDELRSNAGTQFDPYVVESFIDMLDSKGDGYLSAIGYSVLQTIS